MIRDLVLDAQTAEPAVRQVDLNLPAEQPLRADGKNVADDEHPDHQHPGQSTAGRASSSRMQTQHAPRSDRERRRSRAQGDRPVSPRRAENRRKAASDSASAAPSSLASAANRVRATESPFAKAINGLLQQNLPKADIGVTGLRAELARPDVLFLIYQGPTREGLGDHASIQNNSGRPQGPGPCSNAG